MSRPLSPRAQEILAELERDAQRRRSTRSDVPAAAAHLSPTPPAEPAGTLELVGAVAAECHRLQRRLAHVADALDEVAEQLRAAPAPEVMRA